MLDFYNPDRRQAPKKAQGQEKTQALVPVFTSPPAPVSFRRLSSILNQLVEITIFYNP